MEEQFGGRRQFATPEEEINFLREQVAQKERNLEASGQTFERAEMAAEVVNEYKQTPAEDLLAREHQMKTDEIETEVLHLRPEHDEAIDKLVNLLEERGIKNALTVVEGMNSPHLDDDFHRFLIQYISEGIMPEGLKEGTPLDRALHLVLYEVTLPEVGVGGEARSFAQLVSSMEQFYAGMLSLEGERKGVSSAAEHFALELSLAQDTSQVVLFAAVPSQRADLFEKHVLGAFPNARLSQHAADYNPFNDKGASVGAYAVPATLPVFPLKTFKEFDQDPFNIILNTFSRIDSATESATLQFVITPKGPKISNTYKAVLKKVKEGANPKATLEEMTASLGSEFLGVAKDFFFTGKPKKSVGDMPDIDQEAVQNITEKIATPILDVNIRVVASASSDGRAQAILADLTSSFNQFTKPQGNGIVFKDVPEKKRVKFFRNFSYRLFSEEESFPLNTTELTTLFHFPVTTLSAPQLKQATGTTAPAPINMPKEGVLLGVNQHRGEEVPVYISREDRMRHFYAIGQTGTGKTTLLKNMIAQDIANGDGVCMIDPHGTDIADILTVIPEHRKKDVIYFDPAYIDRPMGLNMLEFDERYPEQKTFVVNEMLSIFNKLFDMKSAGGPMFEQYFRNAVLLVLDDPATGTTLLEVSRVLSDASFRELKLLRCRNPIVVQFWREVAGKAGGEASLANIVPYITSKFDVFLSNDIMRPIVGQEKSAFNFRQVMDEKKILLVNLSKGRLGDINAHLIGLILVGKILMAALSRVDTPSAALADFYLYIDEFQNVTTDSIATILSEARKYRLSLNIAHQFIAQLEPSIKDAVFGNVGSLGVFRVGAEDADFLSNQFEPTFTAKDIMNIQNRNAYMKLLVNGSPEKPFNMATLPPPEGNAALAEEIKQLSYSTYGRDRAEVEAEVMKKYGQG